MLSNMRIILVNPTHPGNIGATARAMKTMGLKQLYLVNPKIFPDPEATARASGADDILHHAVITENLESALYGCGLIFGTSARNRTLSWPTLTPRECGEQAAKETAHHQIAIVFGREHAGLTNQELQMCHYHVHIPCDPTFSSLNLAAAVQVIAYEIQVAATAKINQTLPTECRTEYATAEQLEQFYQHLEQTLIAINFLDPQNPRQLLARLRRLYARARPDQNELNILRGILTATIKSQQAKLANKR